jgi:drug/metabolite transporter (DMT)-like permease
VAVLLGVMVAVSFGSGDFFGGRATRNASALGVLVISQACGLVIAAILAIAVAATVAGDDLAFGALAGTVNVFGLGLLYYGLSRYAVGVVAPVAAVVGAVVPIAWGVLDGERPSIVVWVGVVLAIAAGALIAREPDAGTGGFAAGAATAALAGLALGTSLVLFSETSSASGMWPVLAARATAAVLVWTVALSLLAMKRPPRLPQGNGPALAVTVGALDVTATALLLLAIRRGLIIVVAPIASLAPGFTVLLAWRLLGERLVPVQRVGLACALVGLVLVSVG